VDKKFLKVWWIALFVKTALAIWLPLCNDEAYYWVWGHHPQLSYFDHPPMVGWLFTVGTLFEGFGQGVRLPGVWLAHLTLLIWNQIIDPFLDEHKRPWWVLFVLCSPFFGVGSLILTPDLPMTFFWMLSLWLLLIAVGETPIKPGTPHSTASSYKTCLVYIALGFSLGLGFCSKYLIVLFVPATLIWLAFGGRWRKVRWVFVPLTVASGLLACGPVIYWNWKNEWASFAFQLHHGFAGKDPSVRWSLEYIFGQLLLFSPPVLWLALQRREPAKARFLHYFAWFPMAFFLYSSCKSRVEGNWPMMAHPEVMSLALINVRFGTREWKWLKWTAGVWIMGTLILSSQVVYPWLPVDPNKLKTSEFTRFDVYIPDLKAAQVPIYLGSYQAASDMSYKLHRQLCKMIGLGRRDFFDFEPQCLPTSDRFIVGVDVHQKDALPQMYTDKGYVITNTKRLNEDYFILEVEKRAQDTHR